MYMIGEPTHSPNITSGTGFIQPPNENLITVGTSTCFNRGLRIQCTVDTDISGNVTTIEWARDGQIIRSSQTTLTSTLSINSTGNYTCTASNRCGTTSVSSRVVGKPYICNGSTLKYTYICNH